MPAELRVSADHLSACIRCVSAVICTPDEAGGNPMEYAVAKAEMLDQCHQRAVVE